MIEELKAHISNIRGFRTNRKIVIFESDDWGSIRMPSRQVYQDLLKRGIKVDQCPYNRLDSLERFDDLQRLAEVLSEFRDYNGRPALFTLNYLTANPDFEAIRANGFKSYVHEGIQKTLRERDGNNKVWTMLLEGIQAKVFYPQFHGREHLDIIRWMHLLQEPESIFRTAFDFRMWGLGPKVIPEINYNIQAALGTTGEKAFALQIEALEEGLLQFEQLFGFKSKTYIPTNFVLPEKHTFFLNEKGIKGLQGQRFQLFPDGKRKYRYLGQKNAAGQIQLVRNANLEFTEHHKKQVVEQCLLDIHRAFFWKKPAIISTHRLNFIGGIDERNSAVNLSELRRLLGEILKRWPEVEFGSSEDVLTSMINEQ